MTDNNSIITLKELAYGAIAKHSRKIFKYQEKVLEDKDPEDLHQMRVRMRRLRSALSSFSAIVDLPAKITEKNIAKIGRSLGQLRDLDVLLIVLQNGYHPSLSTAEQKKLDRAIKFLKQQRKGELKQVRQTLKGKLYLQLERGLQDWLARPTYQKIAHCSAYFWLPDLLLPQVCQLLLHTGWLVGTEITEGQINVPHVPQTLSQETVEQILSREDTLLHSLRKSAKKTRYNLELFKVFYGEAYCQYLNQIEQIQEVLGQIQDTHVLQQVLEKALKSAITETMPQLAQLLLKTRYQKWLEWQTLQKQFLDEKIRHEFRQVVILSEMS